MPFRDRQGSRRMNTFRFAFRRRPDRVLRYRNREFVVCTGLVQLLLAIGATTAAEPASSRGSASPNKAAAQSPPPKPADSRTVSYVGQEPFPLPAGFSVEQLLRQSPAEAAAKSQSCVQCHQGVGDMHAKPTVRLGCVDCHGGNPGCFTKEGAHVPPALPEAWPTSANPVRSYTLLNHESPEFIRFVNPGDLRVAHISCGACHAEQVLQVRKSMMTHGCMLWGAALYNNGAVPKKWACFGESYSMLGSPQRLQTVPPPNARETAEKGVLPYLDPLTRFEISQPDPQ